MVPAPSGLWEIYYLAAKTAGVTPADFEVLAAFPLCVILSVVELSDEGGTNSSESKSRKARRDLQKVFVVLPDTM